MKVEQVMDVIRLADTDAGDTFYRDGSLLLATDKAKERGLQMNVLCVDVETGEVLWIDEDTLVSIIKTKAVQL